MDSLAPKASATAKYAPWVSLLAEDREHFRRAPGASYWKLAPHYVGQRTECSCSLASATMVINALRDDRAAERHVTQTDVLDAVRDAAWRAGVETDDGHGASGARLADCLARALAAFGVRAVVQRVPVPIADAAVAHRLRAALAGVESGKRLIVAHFHMEAVIGAGDYGHFSPLGAYDATTDRVLVLDVYRVTFEPYWVPLDRLLAGMATRDKVAGSPRGWIEIQSA